MDFDAYFEGFRGKRVLVLGLGVSNRPLVRLLLQYGIDVTGCDKTPREQLDGEVLELERLGAKLHLGEGYLAGLSADVAFRTPGMLPTRPEIAALRQAGTLIASEMEAFFEVCPCTILAVTGSDGKTTTTTLISEMLKAAGKTAFLGGNIGMPLLPLAKKMKPGDFAVVELSSFQLMDMRRSPHVAVVTNLAPNHLDLHGGMEEYVEAKKQIFLHQSEGDILVLNHDNALTDGFREEARGAVRLFSRRERLESGVCLQGGVIYRDGSELLRQSDILLPGIHNAENYMAAICTVEGLVPDDCIRQVARTFGGVEHRIELVRIRDGVSYYNDSIASSPSRTIAGLRSFDKKVILIAGGYDKHIPYDVLGPEICAHVKKLVLTGVTSPKIREAAERAAKTGMDLPEIYENNDFYGAIRQAAALAAPGDVVILSPASASFDRFKNFMVRGEEFKKTVWEL
ncbi:MAG: UDP-N-acetylmuramoyl-L-alanine--D-glutamate ligase [Oscillospiraceae bacterium]|nr:UDP-N-acetylmuramoyl-L-alanine--D-glutamate ligase [Oscillospiraceae bacterium]